MPLIWVLYHGEVGIDAWEWLASVVLLMLLYLYFSRLKNRRLKQEPEYRHFIPGLYVKVLGAVFFSLIYFYYYNGGDTTSYFYSAVAMTHLTTVDPIAFFKVWFGPADQEHLNMFAGTGTQPFGYIYFSSTTFMVVRIITPLVLIALRSYILTAILLSSICYIGVWRCFQTFVGYYPRLTNKFAIAFLYMPSVIFWGSGIMKDTLTLSAACWWVHCFDSVFFKRDRLLFNITGMVIAAAVLIGLKPYIFMMIMPMTVLWLAYYRVAAIKNALIRVGALPLMLVIMLGASYLILDQLGDKFGKFSLDSAMKTTVDIQRDMRRAEEYGTNYFNIGELDGTLSGMVSKFPAAANAALFRPYLWEAKNAVNILSALENAWILGFTLLLLWRTRVWFLVRCIRGNPLVLMCLTFALAYGIMIGLTTPNFGALVRFKIVLIPFLISGYYMVDYLNRERIQAKVWGKQFALSDYLRGDPVRPYRPQREQRPVRIRPNYSMG